MTRLNTRLAPPGGTRSGASLGWRRWRWIPLLVAALTMTPWTYAAESEVVDYEELERQLEEARQQLDEAARNLAELNIKIYQEETEGERSTKPMLGVLIGDQHQADGVTIIGVTPNGGAAEAGLEAGDTLLVVNGYRLDEGENSLKELGQAMEGIKAGDTVAIEYERDETLQIADITTRARGAYAKMKDFKIDLSGLKELEKLGELEALKELSVLGDLGERITIVSGSGHGARFEDVEGDLAGYFGVTSGVVVMQPPESGDLKAGDVLLSIDGEDVDSAASVWASLAAVAEPVEGQVLRGGERQTVTLEPEVVPGGLGKEGVKIHIEHDDDGCD